MVGGGWGSETGLTDKTGTGVLGLGLEFEFGGMENGVVGKG